MSQYRDGLKQVDKDAPITFWVVIKWVFISLVAAVVIGWALQASGIISLNIQREVTQHSQQYTETKVSLLNKLHTDWLNLNAEIAELNKGEGNEEIVSAKRAQQKETVNRIRTEAALIPESQVPEGIKTFLATH